MLKISAITDGISEDLDHALAVLSGAGLKHCEIQDLWGKGVGDLTDAEVTKAAQLLERHDVQPVCLSRKLFVGLQAMKIGPTDSAFVTEMDRLRRCIDIAHKLGAPAIRSMSMQREAILYSRNGPSIWNNGATWDRFVELFQAPVRVAEAAGITLVVETSFNRHRQHRLHGKPSCRDDRLAQSQNSVGPGKLSLFRGEAAARRLYSAQGPAH
ncbi:MAG: TIM barrel protein [Pseudolabrys sp.]